MIDCVCLLGLFDLSGGSLFVPVCSLLFVFFFASLFLDCCVLAPLCVWFVCVFSDCLFVFFVVIDCLRFCLFVLI